MKVRPDPVMLCRTLFLCLFLVFTRQSYARGHLEPCKNNYAPQQQIELGQQAAQQVYREMPVLPDSNPVTKYIQTLGQKLVTYAPGYKWQYQFHVVNVAEINAFALPGGMIFVNLGTIQAAANEAQLAGVMAHEISHVVLQHSVCNAAKQQKVGLIAGLGQVAAGVLLGGAAGQIAQQGIGMTAGLGFLKMSRGAEKEADLMGVGILYDAGYDPRGMSQFFETLQAKYGSGSAQFLSDHPNPGNRSEYVDEEIATFPPRANYVKTSAAFIQIQKQVAGMHAYTAQEVASGVWKRQSPNQTVNNGVNQPVSQTGSADLNTSGNWKTLRGAGFTMDVPGNWQAYGNQSSAMVAPQGGTARSADGRAGTLVYGVLTDRYQPETQMGLSSALTALVAEITRENPGLRAGSQSNITVNGVGARSVDCNNPAGNGGRGERDSIIAFPQNDGSLRYFVFVAPTPDFDKLKPTFERILQSTRIQ
jgi:hypothetical protein